MVRDKKFLSMGSIFFVECKTQNQVEIFEGGGEEGPRNRSMCRAMVFCCSSVTMTIFFFCWENCFSHPPGAYRVPLFFLFGVGGEEVSLRSKLEASTQLGSARDILRH